MGRRAPDLLLGTVAAAFAVAAFGGGVPAFDDHPGQYFRLWHALERSLPGGYWTPDWNPDWWAGYPELQFYPPGFALLGALIRLVSLWRLPVEVVYQVLCGLVLALPAFTTLWLMGRVVEDRWLALPPAVLALTLSAGLRGGVEESMRWGMLTSRLALGLLPLVLLAARAWIAEGRRPTWVPWAMAAVLLAHPASGPAILAIAGLATLLSLALHPERRTLRDAATAAVLALALTGFWILPLVARRDWVVPLAWGGLSPSGLAEELLQRPVLLVLVLAAPLAWVVVLRRRRPFEALLAALPLVLVLVLAADIALFDAGWSPIEPARIWDSLVFSLLWAAGLGTGALLPRSSRRPSRRQHHSLHALAACALLALLSIWTPRGPLSEPTLTLWPLGTGWPSLDTLRREHDLPRLWAALSGTPDRVLFATSSLRLDEGAAWYSAHSHVTSLTPLYAGREIIHGTFTHPSPLAARFYTGASAPPRRLLTLTEEQDGRVLLGQPWEHLTAERFDAFARRLRIATVVVPARETSRAQFLGPSYARTHEAAGFAIFQRHDRPWPVVERINHRRYRVLASPAGGVWIPTGISAYPLWQVKSRQGPLETRVDAWGLLEFRVPLDVFEAELVYREGPLEWTGLGATLLGVAAWLAWAWRGRGHARLTARAEASPRTESARGRR